MKTIRLPFRVRRPVLACGADMKGAFALARDDKAYLFDGFGDLSDLDNFMKYEKSVREAEKKLKIKPKIVVCDLHPQYFSTQFAEKKVTVTKSDSHFFPLFKVQHHEAHVASAMVDNNIKGDVLGAAFDGTGYGLDGNIWGGEFFTGNAKCFKRVAHLEYIPMPGGKACIREPWRMAASYLYKYRDTYHFSVAKLVHVPIFSVRKIVRVPIFQMIEKNINSPMTSSMGRLFDAVGSLVLNKERSGFEAELPIELEKIIDKNEQGYYDFELKNKGSGVVINMARTIKEILKDLHKKVPRPEISAKFHNTIARMILKTAKRFNAKNVVLSGGVFQNKFLSEKARELLEGRGFKVYTHLNVETNDLSIPIGQIAIANARL